MRVYLALFMLFLAACNNPPAPTPPALEAKGGTLNWSDTEAPGTVWWVIFKVPGNPPQQSISYSVTGPTGWNGDKVLRETTTQVTPGNDSRVYFQTPIAAVTGRYTYQTTVGGISYFATFDINASQLLPRVVPTASSISAANASISFPAVSAAQQYVGAIYGSGNSAIKADAKGTPNFSFSGLSISPGNYTWQVDAYSAPVFPVAGVTIGLPSTQFNISRRVVNITVP